MRILLSVIMMLWASVALAEDADHLTIYSGYFDITQSDDAAAQLGMEYRFAPVWEGLRPVVGANFTTDSALHGYSGFHYDMALTDSIIFSPNVVVGAFSHGDGKDLGHWIQFRSGLELQYQFESEHRVGLSFNHISNASIGDRNPGAETLLINYQMPIH